MIERRNRPGFLLKPSAMLALQSLEVGPEFSRTLAAQFTVLLQRFP